MFFNKLSEQKKQKEELGRIFREHGCYSDEYIETFQAYQTKPNADSQLILVSIYIEMGRLEEAKKALMNVDFGLDKLIDNNAKAKKIHLQIMLDLAEGKTFDARDTYKENTHFLDKTMKNPFISNIAGDYYAYAAALTTLTVAFTEHPDVKKYLARLREWCDTYPKNRILYDITQVWLAYVKSTHAMISSGTGMESVDAKKEAEAAAAKCRETILDFDGFSYEWEREFYLNRLDRVIKHAM